MARLYNRKLPWSTTANCSARDYPPQMARKTKGKSSASVRKEIAERFIRALDEFDECPKAVGKRNPRIEWVAKRWKVSRENARKWLRGLSVPEHTRAVEIATDLGISIDWWLQGVGEMRLRPVGHPLSLKGDNFQQTKKATADWPLLSWAGLAKRGNAMNRVEEPEPGERNPLASLSRDTFLLIVRGASMEPKFRDGGVIFVDPAAKPKHGSYVVARLPGAETATLKQLVVEDGRKLLKAQNPAWPEQFAPLGAGEILGVVRFYGEET